MIKLTGPQLRALQFYALPERDQLRRWAERPRRDLVGRLVPLGLLTVRTEWVHAGTTYRSRQRLTVVDVKATPAGRALLDTLSD